MSHRADCMSLLGVGAPCTCFSPPPAPPSPEAPMRHCFLCGKDLGQIGGFSLARDLLPILRGEVLGRGETVREICQSCADTGPAEKWLAENPPPPSPSGTPFAEALRAFGFAVEASTRHTALWAESYDAEQKLIAAHAAAVAQAVEGLRAKVLEEIEAANWYDSDAERVRDPLVAAVKALQSRTP